MLLQTLKKELQSANQAFNQAYKRLHERAQQREASERELKEKKKKLDEQTISDDKLLEIDYEAEETMDFLLKAVPVGVFNPKLYEEAQRFKVRNIPVERKIRIFSGFFEKQKKYLEDQKKEVQLAANIVPEQLTGGAEFKIKNNNK